MPHFAKQQMHAMRDLLISTVVMAVIFPLIWLSQWGFGRLSAFNKLHTNANLTPFETFLALEAIGWIVLMVLFFKAALKD